MTHHLENIFLNSSYLLTCLAESHHCQRGSHDAVAAIWPAKTCPDPTTMCSSWHCRQILHTCRHFVASMHALIHLCLFTRISVLVVCGTRRGIRVNVVSTISKGLSRVPPRLIISMIWAIILAVESVTIPHGGRTFLYLLCDQHHHWQRCVRVSVWCAWCAKRCAWYAKWCA